MTRRFLPALAAAATSGAIALSAQVGAPTSVASGHGFARASDTERAAATFRLVRSDSVVASGCIPNAKATVTITNVKGGQRMDITASGLPRRTGFDLFLTQAAGAPFGMSWYQGDVTSNRWGKATASFVGIFSRETFTVAPGTTSAPQFDGSDASSNPTMSPLHQTHVGLWFNSATKAASLGCDGTVTPFNGDHHAGVQAMSTRQFGLIGPLGNVV